MKARTDRPRERHVSDVRDGDGGTTGDAPMRQRSRFKRVAVAATLSWVATILVWVQCGNGRSWEVGIGRGGLVIEWGKTIDHICLHEVHYHEYADGLVCRVLRLDGMGMVLWPMVSTPGNGCFVLLPLWPIYAPIALYGAYLWWRDRRIPVGHCRTCGYNLRGNVSGECSECGQQISTRIGCNSS